MYIDKQSQLFEKLNIQSNLFGFQNHEAKATCPFRILSDYEIIYNIGGTTIVTIENQSYNISCGDLILIPNFTRHKIDTPKNNPHSNFWLHFSLDNSLLSHNFINNILEKFGGFSYKIGLDETLISIYKKMLYNQVHQADFSNVLLQAYSKELIIYIINKLNIKLNETFIIDNPTHYNVIKYVSENYMNLHNLEDISKFQNISLTYCNFIFKKHLGISPSKYIMQLKLKSAEKLLKNSNKSIHEISDELNFSSQYHFSNTFKSYYGMNPSSFRKLNINI